MGLKPLLVKAHEVKNLSAVESTIMYTRTMSRRSRKLELQFIELNYLFCQKKLLCIDTL